MINIPHEECLIAGMKALDTIKDLTTSRDPLMELAECALRNNIFEQDNPTFKQPRGTAIGTKMPSPYAILLLESLEKEVLSSSLLKPLFWWCYINDIVMI